MKTALLGCGRWGRRLLRALAAHPAYEIAAVVDPSPVARAEAAPFTPIAVAHLDDAPRVDAIFIATPSPLHAAHAEAALARDAHVFVEKPLAMRRADAERLVHQAATLPTPRVAMVGHVLRFDPRVLAFVAALRAGHVGELRHIRAERFTQSGSPDPLWTLAPHDVATLHAIDPSPVVAVQTHDLARPTTLGLTFASGLQAEIAVATQGDHPRRQMRARGTDGLLVLDELRSQEQGPTALQRELDHFARCVHEGNEPLTSFREGLAVVTVLEAAARATPLRAGSVGSSTPR
ncbi:MAG: Gfo/Idh/MocA family oxidoreductase [Polyangiaceae bacterium]